MRCVSLGEPSPELAEGASILAEIQDRQIAAMVPGALASEVDAILRQGVLQAGLRPSYDNITGYTLGLYAPAGPRTSDFTRIFTPVSNWRIEAGMVFHMYASAAGASFSETVGITEDGPECLTKFPRSLIVNPLSPGVAP
jgi:Xaa-Pro dipeptidase